VTFTVMVQHARTYKKDIMIIEASRTADLNITNEVVVGKESQFMEQTNIADPDVPVGSRVTRVLIMWQVGNLVNSIIGVNWALQLRRSGQGVINPRDIGQSDLRNTVIRSGYVMVGQNQNTGFVKSFKIPKMMQRVRQGDQWTFVRKSGVGAVFTDGFKCIYKIIQ